MTRQLLPTLFLIFALVGCATPTPTPASTASLAPTATAFLPTETPIPLPSLTLTPMSTPNPHYSKNCLQIPKQEVQLQDVAKGTVVLGEWSEGFYLFDLQSQTRHEIIFDTSSKQVFDYLYGLHISPNRNYLAYMEAFRNADGKAEKFKLRVIDSNGKILASRTINSTILTSGWRWLDNERLEILPETAIQNGEMVIFNPFSNDWKSVTNQLPNIHLNDYVRPTWWLVEYSPSLDWVIYLAESSEAGFGPSIWDLTDKRMIWQKFGMFTMENRPIWSPTGDRIAIIFENQLYIIGRNGQAISPPGLLTDDKLETEKFSWSPDGRYIAFWVIRDAMGYLMLYDVENGRVVDYCLEDVERGNSPVWSPDSKLFATSIYVDDTKNATRSEIRLIIDIQKNNIYRIPESSYPWEWMNSIP